MGQEQSYSPQEPPLPSPESDDFLLDLVLEASRHTSRIKPYCRFYAKGNCSRGDDCAFGHDEEIHVPQVVQLFKDSPKPLCRFYMRGGCNKGSSCQFRHDDTFRSSDKEPSAKRAAPCRFFLKGICAKGELCLFQHDTATKEEDVPQTSNEKPSSFSRTLGGADVDFAAGATVSSLTFSSDPSMSRNSKAAHNSLQMSSVSCKWNRACKEVWIYYGQLNTAFRARDALDGKEFHGTIIKAVYGGLTFSNDMRISNGPFHSIILENVDKAVSYRELKDFCSTRMVHPKHIKFGDSSYDIREARAIITEILEEKCGPVLDFHVNTAKDPSKITAIVRFAHPEDAQRAVKELNGTNITQLGYSPLYITPVFAVRFTLRQDLYSAIAKDVKNLILKLSTTDNVQIVAYNTEAKATGPPILRVHGEDAQSVARAKSSLETILAGTICVSEDRKNTTGAKLVWDPFFARYEGICWLKTLMTSLDVFIYADARRGQLRLYGDQKVKEAANVNLVKKCKELEIARQKHKIHLDEELFKAALSGGVKHAEEILGTDRVKLEITPTAKFLTVSGSARDARAVREILHQGYDIGGVTSIPRQSSQGNITQPSEGIQTDLEQADENTCAVCWTAPSIPYRTRCNHLYCTECFDNQVNTAIAGVKNSLPLLCCHDSCGRAFALEELRNALSSQRFESLMKSSFESYIRSQPQSFKYCPTPDCNQIYRVSGTDKNSDTKLGRIFYCPSCLSAVCTLCHFFAHVGYSCGEYERLRQDAERDAQKFAAWKQDHDARDCPKCSTTIEKNDGCNHMECVGCKAHICWFCMKVFDTSGECYGHMTECHNWGV